VRNVIRMIMILCIVSVSSCLCGCTFKVTNTELGFKSLPEGAWAFRVASPDFTIDSSLDAEKTATEIIKGIKVVADEIMGLPIFSLIGGMFEGPPAPTVTDGG